MMQDRADYIDAVRGKGAHRSNHVHSQKISPLASSDRIYVMISRHNLAQSEGKRVSSAPNPLLGIQRRSLNDSSAV